MLNFGDLHHPKDQKRAKKEAIKLHTEAMKALQDGKSVPLGKSGKNEGQQMVPPTLKFHSKILGPVELPVYLMHNKVTDLKGRVIYKPHKPHYQMEAMA